MWDSPLYPMNVLLPLANKETASAHGRAEYSKVGNPSRDRGGKKAESGRHHVAAQETRGKKLQACGKI